MKKLLLPLLAFLIFAGCASSAKMVKRDILPAPDGQVAVFGRVMLINTINGVSMPADNLQSTIYLRNDAANSTYEISTIDSGDFGVYLPPGAYRAVEIKTQNYKFLTDLKLTVPSDHRAAYTGTIILDGEPDGVIPGTMNGAVVHAVKKLLFGTVDTWFVYQVKDNQDEFESRLRRAAPRAEVRFAKALFTPSGGAAAGYYPDTVSRPKDMVNTVKASSDMIEDIAGGIVVSLPYYLNPLVFITLPL